jgi:outer membrane protein assembly factor BamB/Icc-related predicted phosphoesterase
MSRFRTIAALLFSVLALSFARDISAAEAFRFAWLSDTHVGSLTGEEDLRATVNDLNSSTGLSFVILSGDVTEFGSGENLRLAKQILDGIKIPVHVIPGNHDTKWSESGATDFGKIWGADRFDFEFGGYRFIGMHEGPVLKMSDGFWAPQDVRWLASTLKSMTQKDQPLIFVTHYPIDDGIANWFVALDILKQHNIQAALCGHIHRNNKASFEGVPGIMGRSNLRGNADAGGYTIVEVKDGQMTFSERDLPGETKAPWHSIPLEKHDFASDTNKYPRPDFSVNARYPGVKETWRVDTGCTIASSPAVWKDLAIAGDASGVLRAVDLASGAERWRFKTAGAIYSTPDTSGDLAVIASTDGRIYALHARDGTEAWRFETQRPIVASPRIANGLVFIGSSEGKFRALNLKSGKLVWEFSGLDGFVETKPLVYDNKVIFGAWDEHLYALDAASGKLAWKWKADKPGILYSPAACWPVAAHGKVFIVAPDRMSTVLDAKTGNQLWRSRDYMVRESIGLSEDQSKFYVRTMQDFIDTLSTTDQPKKLWESKPGFGYDINSAMLVEKSGVVFYGSKNGLLIALDAKTGAIQWEHKLGVGVINTVVPLDANRVLTTDFDGRLILVHAK